MHGAVIASISKVHTATILILFRADVLSYDDRLFCNECSFMKIDQSLLSDVLNSIQNE
jgi:hypothetical protein